MANAAAAVPQMKAIQSHGLSIGVLFFPIVRRSLQIAATTPRTFVQSYLTERGLMPDQSKRPPDAPHKIPRKWWTWLKLPGRFHVAKPAAFWAWRKWRLSPKRQPVVNPVKPVKMLMFDDVTVSLIPKNAEAVAGYSDGHYQTWQQILKDFPHAKHLQIAVFGQDNGDCLDVEPGDASIAQAAAWVKRQLAGWSKSHHDVTLPVVYTSASQAQRLVAELAKAGLKQHKHYLLWTAHYNPALGEHLCSPKCTPGLRVTADATQFTDHALNRSLDESICSPGFFGSPTTAV